MKTTIKMTLGAIALTSAFAAHADVTVGVSISSTGPAASLGIPEKNTLDMLPTTLGGQPVKYIVLDDATDPATANKNARRFVESDKVDVIIGGSTVPTSMAMIDAAVSSKTPQIGLAPFPVKPEQLAWVFPLPQSVALMASSIYEDMKKKNVKTVGFVGFSDGWGEAWVKELQARLESQGMKLVGIERYARNDQSVTGQALKLMAANPDAVLVGASGTPGVLPMRTLRERGYKGQIYQTHGVANADFLRLAGNSDEGVLLPTGPVLVAEQLPDSHPSKRVAFNYVTKYETKYGQHSRNNFGAHAYDAYLVLDHAVAEAVKKAAPGTPEFRSALRDAIEATRELPVTHGVINMSKQDHSGFDERGRVLITIYKDNWKIVK